MITRKRRYVIYAPDYDEDSGGTIALHRLCDLLNKNGVKSCLYAMRPPIIRRKSFSYIRKVIKTFQYMLKKKKCRTHDEFLTPLCTDIDITNDVVVYPEIVTGNPLGADHVVRWLLHEPGYFSGNVTFGVDDLFFYYQKAFLKRGDIRNIGGELKVIYFQEAYRKNNSYQREGTCYILRKGKNREIVHDLKKSVLIDGLPHKEIAEIFNKSEVCVSYDMYTMYSRYAAACGCLSIVVPEAGVDKYQWRPEEELRWGIAYGFNDVQWAKDTQEKVLPSLLYHEEISNSLSIDNFIKKCEDSFFKESVPSIKGLHEIDILLSTYNGEKHLPEQIESLFEQTFNDWRLMIRDDGSTDATVPLVQSLVLEHPDKVIFIEDELGNLGPSQSFSILMSHSSAPYIAFCDQDDVWMQDKLELQLQEMIKAEEKSGEDTPILIHTDLKVVGESMKEWSDSFWQYQHINPVKMKKLNRLLLQNSVTGCTCLLNRSLIEKSSPIPGQAIMHDWWFALLAVSLGEIRSINTATVKYRQHAMNDTGTKEWNLRHVLSAMFRGRKQLHEDFIKTRNQAKVLLESGTLNEEHIGIVSRYIDLFDHGYVFKRLVIIRMRFFKYGFFRNIGFLLRF